MESIPSDFGHSEEESFIILGSSSPQTSLDVAMMESKILERSTNASSKNQQVQNINDDLFKSTSSTITEDSVPAFKAHFNIEKQPSPAVLEMASSLMSDFTSTSDIQHKLAEMINENTILRETLNQNNLLMKDQFKKIVSWQDDMMTTQQIHKTKFAETKGLIEKLRLENSILKKELETVKQNKSENVCNGDSKVNGSLCSPTSLENENEIEKLTSKLELVERQRRQVIEHNEKLLISKENLEKELSKAQDVCAYHKSKVEKMDELHVENMALKKELSMLKEEKISLLNSKKEMEASVPVFTAHEDDFVIAGGINLTRADLESTIDTLTGQLEIIERQRRQVLQDNEKMLLEKESLEVKIKSITEENADLKLMIQGIEDKLKKSNREETQLLEEKLSNVRAELKKSQLKLLESENMKLEYTQHKLESQENMKKLSDNVAELKERLREAHTITFQPVRYSISLESQCDSSEFTNFVENVKLYDKTLKELAGYLNNHSEMFLKLYNDINSSITRINDKEVDMSLIKNNLATMKESVDHYYTLVPNNNYQVKSTLSFLEKVFLDYQQVLRILKDLEMKHSAALEKCKGLDANTALVEHLKEKLAGSQRKEDMLVMLVNNMQKDMEERDVLRAQLDIYKTDFEAERDSRTKLASEKETILSNLRELQRRNQELVEELDNFKGSNPHIFGNMNTQPSTPNSSRAQPSTSGIQYPTNSRRENGDSSPPFPRFPCPVCNVSFKSLKMLEDHIETCLDTSEGRV